ncbi:hypothetical protein EIP91_010246, partial [Steccherinum ochraceum]
RLSLKIRDQRALPSSLGDALQLVCPNLTHFRITHFPSSTHALESRNALLRFLQMYRDQNQNRPYDAQSSREAAVACRLPPELCSVIVDFIPAYISGRNDELSRTYNDGVSQIRALVVDKLGPLLLDGHDIHYARWAGPRGETCCLEFGGRVLVVGHAPGTRHTGRALGDRALERTTLKEEWLERSRCWRNLYCGEGDLLHSVITHIPTAAFMTVQVGYAFYGRALIEWGHRNGHVNLERSGSDLDAQLYEARAAAQRLLRQNYDLADVDIVLLPGGRVDGMADSPFMFVISNSYYREEQPWYREIRDEIVNEIGHGELIVY